MIRNNKCEIGNKVSNTTKPGMGQFFIRRNNMRKGLITLLCTVIFVNMLLVSPVFAYSGSAAKNYADTYATSPNSGVYPVFSEDCTNFTSQALFAGGYSMIGAYPNNSTDDHYWYFDHYYNVYTHSWSVAADQVQFQLWHSPGGYWGMSYGGNIGGGQYNDAAVGDLISYDWYYTGVTDHLAIEIGTGTDPDPNGGHWVGDLVDAHTTNHYHAYWTLQPYNAAHYQTTLVKTLHIYSSN
jgi:hypothetical protein